ncbi:MAG: hypothetical protein PHN44_05175 [Candidatus Marinimicrobia bacterium]|nr:hypothetical protein [Candidatus Neomarinimicrobiota bacterium]
MNKNKTYLKIKRDRDGRWVAYTTPRTRPQVVIVGLIFIAYLICYMIYGNQAIASGADDRGREAVLEHYQRITGSTEKGRLVNEDSTRFNAVSEMEIGTSDQESDPASDFCIGIPYIECEGEAGSDRSDDKGGDHAGRITSVVGYDLSSFQAIRTRYSRKDSCHNPKGKKCLTANGEDTTEGRTVACPRNLPLGTRLKLSDEPNHVYTCTDRYASYLDARRGMPTIDVFAEAENLGKIPARKVVTVTIVK